jgi:hypothetical protein
MTGVHFIIGCLVLSIPIWIIGIGILSLAETARIKK